MFHRERKLDLTRPRVYQSEDPCLYVLEGEFLPWWFLHFKEPY